jgi:hypothetical protein
MNTFCCFFNCGEGASCNLEPTRNDDNYVNFPFVYPLH